MTDRKPSYVSDTWNFSKVDERRKEGLYNSLHEASAYSSKIWPEDREHPENIPYLEGAEYAADQIEEHEDVQLCDLRHYSFEAGSLTDELIARVGNFASGRGFFEPVPEVKNQRYDLLTVEGRNAEGEGVLYFIGDSEGIQEVNDILNG